MSLSKYREGGVLKIPGLMTPRIKSCCLACGFKAIGVQEEFVQQIVKGYMNIGAVLDLKDNTLYKLFTEMSSSKQKAIMATCKNLLDYFNGDQVPIMHDEYYQSVTFKLGLKINEEIISVGFLRRGHVLEVYKAYRMSLEAWELIQELKIECTTTTRGGDLYDNLPRGVFDTCMEIHGKSFEFSVTQSGGNIVSSSNYVIDQADYNFKLRAIRNHLLGIQSMSLILIHLDAEMVVKGCGAVNWLKFLKSIFLNIDHLVVVFQVSYSDYLDHGFTSKRDVRNLVNNEYEKEFAGLISWLDFSSIDDTLLERNENGANENRPKLEVKLLE